MSQIIPLRSPDRADRLWEDYHALAQAAINCPALLLDREHVEATIRAHERFKRAFLAVDTGK